MFYDMMTQYYTYTVLVFCTWFNFAQLVLLNNLSILQTHPDDELTV
jgi:hypothetical protein